MFHHIAINAYRRGLHQLIVSTPFSDSSFVQDSDLVGTAYCSQPLEIGRKKANVNRDKKKIQSYHQTKTHKQFVTLTGVPQSPQWSDNSYLLVWDHLCCAARLGPVLLVQLVRR